MSYPVRVTVDFNKAIINNPGELTSFKLQITRSLRPYSFDIFPTSPFPLSTHPYQFIYYGGNPAYPPKLIVSDTPIYATVTGTQVDIWVKGYAAFYTLYNWTYTYYYGQYVPNGDGNWHYDTHWTYSVYTDVITMATFSDNIKVSSEPIYIGEDKTGIFFTEYVLVNNQEQYPASAYLDENGSTLYLYFMNNYTDEHCPTQITLTFIGDGISSEDGGIMRNGIINLDVLLDEPN